MVADRAAHSRRTQLNYKVITYPDAGPLVYGEPYGYHITVRRQDWSGVRVCVFAETDELTDEIRAETLAKAEAIRDLLNA